MTEGRRLLFWEGDARKDFKSLPLAAQKDLGVALFVMQLGGTPSCAEAWPLRPGETPAEVPIQMLVHEHRGHAFRAALVARVQGAVHVLHAWQHLRKPEDGAVPSPDVGMVERRLAAAIARHASVPK